MRRAGSMDIPMDEITSLLKEPGVTHLPIEVQGHVFTIITNS